MKKRKVIVSFVLALSFGLSSVAAGCSSGTSADSTANPPTTTAGGSVTLSVYSNPVDIPVQNAIKDACKSFEGKNSEIKVDLNFPGQDYENILKVKMASNMLPDVFDTHGWAKVRYGKYLADLRDSPWVPKLSDSIKDVVTDSSGKVYVLPMVEAKDGIVYNADMLKKYNISVPKTFDELEAAAIKIKQESGGSVAPFFFSVVDNYTIAQFLDEFSTPLLISPSKNYKNELLSDKFDWNNWTKLPEKLVELKQKGLINSDMMAVKASDIAQRFATGKTCFWVGSLTIADQVASINPSINLGLMPVPAFDSSDTPSFSGGERYTMGIWKDTKNMDAAKKLINFLAQGDDLKAIAGASNAPAGLKDVKANTKFQTYFDDYSNTRVFPYFDRTYVANGMWDVMSKSGGELLAGQITPEQFSSTMHDENERLLKKS